jgi:formylglycine-generating enzyme required for sulfatase activity
MFDYVTRAIVRILDAGHRPVGAGCLVRERLIVTCAHVVAEALGLPRDTAEVPTAPIALDFPFVASTTATARAILWWPYRQAGGGDRRHDLAVLELQAALRSVDPGRLLMPGHERPGPIHVYGFPEKAGLGDAGDWIEGRVTPLLPNDWLKLVQRDQQARFIEPGCSGGPVIVDETGLVAGIVSLRRSGSGPAEAYGISATLIREALAEMGRASTLTGASGTGAGLRPEPERQSPKPRPTPVPLSVIQDHPLAPKLVVLPRGEFLMGSQSDADAYPEKPQHRVRIDYDLAMGQSAVTFEEWDLYAADVDWHAKRHVEPYRPDDAGWGRGPRPVIKVSWEDIQGYLRWLSDRTGHRYRLPSEAEWEYACRAGTTTAYHFGPTVTHYDANFGRKLGKTAEAISYSPNAWGLYNMHGNVWEWCQDCWNGDYVGAPVDGSAWHTARHSWDDSYRVVRGGSCSGIPAVLRSANRFRIRSVFRVYDVGFRVARTLVTP